MSRNVEQVYTDNPTTSLPGTALIYVGISPFGPTDDSAITWTNLQSSITGLGTITSGTWNGSIIGPTYGGTGVNNGSSTITIGGNVAFSGAYTFTGTLTGNTNVTFPTSGTLATTTQTVTWVDASVSQTMAPQTGYKVNGSGLISLALPTTAAENTVIEVAGYSASGWIITQSAGQQILFDAVATTLGATGSVASVNRYDCIRLLVAVANTTFVVLSSMGNLTIV